MISRFTFRTYLIAILVTTTGFDLLSIQLGSTTFRYSYFLYLALFLYFIRRVQFDYIQTILILSFVGFSLPSVYYSTNSIKSLMYAGWVIYTYLVVFGIFYYIAKTYKDETFLGLLYSFRGQIGVGVVLFILNVGKFGRRVYLLYYEPSYYAIAMSIYASIVFVSFIKSGFRTALPDLLMLAIAVLITQSMTLVLVLITVAGTGLLILRLTLKTVVGIIVLSILFYTTSYFYAIYGKDLLAESLYQIHHTDDIVNYLVARGGNRVPRMEVAWDVFKDNIWVGTGLGAFDSYTRVIDVSEYSRGLKWLSVESKPAINIYLELLATTGLVGSIPIFLFFLRIITLKRINYLNIQQLSYLLAVVSMLIILNIESNYLRPYLWMILGIYAGSVAPTDYSHNLSPTLVGTRGIKPNLVTSQP